MSLENPHIIRQLTPFEHIPQKRLFPMRAAKTLLSGTTHPESSDQLNAEEREEQLALEGIVIYWMVDSANELRKCRPPYGLVYSENGFSGDFSTDNMKIVEDANLLGNPFSTFSFAIRHTLAYALGEKLKLVLAKPESQETKIYRKYVEYVSRKGTTADDPYAIKYAVFSSNTALRIMEDIISHSTHIDSTQLKKRPTINESTIAARNSIPLILKLSSFEHNVFNTIYRYMSEGGIWRSLTVVRYGENMHFQIKDSVLQNAIDQLSHPDIKEKVENKSREGCPARMRFEGKKSAIETLWNWYIDYSEMVSKNKADKV